MRAKVSSRLIAPIGALSFSALAVVSGLDRLSPRHPELARFVPAPLAARAHRVKAAEGLRSTAQPDASTVAAARAAVAADPIDPRSTALLGAALLASGEAARADRAFRVAARFGWRDAQTQLYLMDRAQKSGETALAALRLDAVLRQNPLFPLRDMFLARFEATPQGRAALAARLALRPAWTIQFLGQDNQPQPATLRHRAQILQAVSGPGWGCDAIAPLVNRLIAAAEVAPAKQVWARHCPAASPGIADSSFADFGPRKRTPFDWNLPSSGDIATVPAASPATGLTARVSGASSQMVAWQMLTLRPGSYRVSWSAAELSDKPTDSVSLSLSCTLSDRIPLSAREANSAGTFTADVTLTDACAGQYLTIWLAPTGQDVTIDSVTIKPSP